LEDQEAEEDEDDETRQDESEEEDVGACGLSQNAEMPG
jgi:hypothetical protein